MKVPITIKSNQMDLKSLLFDGKEDIELPKNAIISYLDTDADLTGFETEVILDAEVEINSTEAVEPVSDYLYDKMQDLDMVEINIKERHVDMTEEDIRRGLLKAYYKN